MPQVTEKRMSGEQNALLQKQKAFQDKKDRAEKIEMEHLAAERARVADVVRRHKELHPTEMTECPVCLEEIEMTEHGSMIYFYCCGKGTCHACFKKNCDNEGSLFGSKCPCCRGKIDSTVVARTKSIKKCAKKGFSWAQFKMAQYYLEGYEEGNVPIDEKKYIQSLQLACEGSSPDLDAMVLLAIEYDMGTIVEKSTEKADALRKKAADMGSRKAQEMVALHLYDNKNGISIPADVVYYATLAVGERPQFNHYGAAIYSAYVLGNAFLFGQGGLERNLFLARHYLKIAVQGNDGGNEDGYVRAYSDYGDALYDYGMEVYGDASVPGFSPTPKAIYWQQKAAASGCAGCGNPRCWKEVTKRVGEKSRALITSMESQQCSYCFKAASPGEKMKHCARCSGAWYCGRECQAAAWKAGHKLDCVKLSGPFEAALH